MPNGKSRKVNGAQSIERAIAVLRSVASVATGGSTLTQIVETSRLSKATVHRILAALTREGLVERSTDSATYHLGEQLYALGILAAPRLSLHELAMPALRRLAAVSEDSAFLCLRSGHDVICVHREEGSHPIRTHVMQVGLRYPLGVGSFGPAILAAMDDEEVDRILRANRREITRFGEYSVDKVRRFIKVARAKGYSLNPGLVFPESYGLAVAILDERNQPVGTLSIGAVASRMQGGRQQELADVLKGEAIALSKLLKGASFRGSSASNQIRRN